jgi:hypothetical protein
MCGALRITFAGNCFTICFTKYSNMWPINLFCLLYCVGNKYYSVILALLVSCRLRTDFCGRIGTEVRRSVSSLDPETARGLGIFSTQVFEQNLNNRPNVVK